MPGYPVELTVDIFADYCVCIICHDLMKAPRQCPNGHIFCNECILKHLRVVKNACPLCSCRLKESDLGINLLVQNIIAAITIHCTNTGSTSSHADDIKKGNKLCDWIGKIEHLENHLNQCELSKYAIIRCPNRLCNLAIQRLHLADHEKVCTAKQFLDCCEQTPQRTQPRLVRSVTQRNDELQRHKRFITTVVCAATMIALIIFMTVPAIVVVSMGRTTRSAYRQVRNEGAGALESDSRISKTGPATVPHYSAATPAQCTVILSSKLSVHEFMHFSSLGCSVFGPGEAEDQEDVST